MDPRPLAWALGLALAACGTPPSPRSIAERPGGSSALRLDTWTPWPVEVSRVSVDVDGERVADVDASHTFHALGDLSAGRHVIVARAEVTRACTLIADRHESLVLRTTRTVHVGGAPTLIDLEVAGSPTTLSQRAHLRIEGGGTLEVEERGPSCPAPEPPSELAPDPTVLLVLPPRC